MRAEIEKVRVKTNLFGLLLILLFKKLFEKKEKVWDKATLDDDIIDIKKVK